MSMNMKSNTNSGFLDMSTTHFKNNEDIQNLKNVLMNLIRNNLQK
jgi:hypothetical protein